MFLAGGTKKNQPDRVHLSHQLSKSRIKSVSDAKTETMSRHYNLLKQSEKLQFAQSCFIIITIDSIITCKLYQHQLFH